MHVCAAKAQLYNLLYMNAVYTTYVSLVAADHSVLFPSGEVVGAGALSPDWQ